MALERFKWLAVLLAIIWVLALVNLITGYSLNAWFGLKPRAFGGLDGVVFMPVLHGSVAHAAANTVPLAVLGALVLASAPRAAWPASGLIVIVSGLGVWLFGQTAIHVGASGLIFGWFAYLLVRGVVEKRLVPILVSLGVGFFYGTMVWGVLPGQEGVSWEAHLFGAIAGIMAAFLLRSGD